MKGAHVFGLFGALALGASVIVLAMGPSDSETAALAIVPPAIAADSANKGAQATDNDGLKSAIFAAGCYWCTESDFDKVKGVKETISGFTGGHVKNPTYGDVGKGRTGHTEGVLVRYDPKVVSYNELLDFYWRHTDFFDPNGQFCDRGTQYRPEIFVYDADQRKLAEESRQAIATRFKSEIPVPITDASTFYPAKASHQNYYKKHPVRYKAYRWNCGRDQRMAEIWGDKKKDNSVGKQVQRQLGGQ